MTRVFYPDTKPSKNWKHWITIIDLRRCIPCMLMHGQIFGIDEILFSIDEPKYIQIAAVQLR